MAKASLKLRTTVIRDGDGFDTLARTVERGTGNAAQKWATNVKRKARELVPKPPGIAPRTPWAKDSPSGYVRTGNLAASIEKERVGPKHWKVYVGAYYGIYVEYGTRYMIAQPYFRPAIRYANAEFRKDIQGVFRGRVSTR